MKCVEVAVPQMEYACHDPYRSMIHYLYENGMTMEQATTLVRRFTGATNQELADERGTIKQTVANLLFRARRKLPNMEIRYCNQCYHAPECKSFYMGFKEQATVCDLFRRR